MADPKNALVVVESPELSADSSLLPKLQATALHQAKLIHRTESEAAQRAVLLGLTLYRIKASMKGKFSAWLKKDFTALKTRQARYYMAVGLAFVEKTRATLPDFLALPGDQAEFALDSVPGDKARTMMKKIERFVKGRPIGQLLTDLGIREDQKKQAKEIADDEPAASKPAPAADASQSLYTEAAEHLHALRITLTDDKALVRMQPKQLDELKDSLTQLQQEFSAKHRLARGKTK